MRGLHRGPAAIRSPVVPKTSNHDTGAPFTLTYEIRISSRSAKIFVLVLSAAVLVLVLAMGSQRSITSTRTSTNSWPWVAGVGPRWAPAKGTCDTLPLAIAVHTLHALVLTELVTQDASGGGRQRVWPTRLAALDLFEIAHRAARGAGGQRCIRLQRQ
jgi:hypothetical protein